MRENQKRTGEQGLPKNAVSDALKERLRAEKSEYEYPTPRLVKVVDGVEYYRACGNRPQQPVYPFTYCMGEDFIVVRPKYGEPFERVLCSEEKAKLLRVREQFMRDFRAVLNGEGFRTLKWECYTLGYRVEEGRYGDFMLCIGENTCHQCRDFGAVVELVDDRVSLYHVAVSHEETYLINYLKYAMDTATQEEADYCNAIDGGMRFVPEKRAYGAEDIAFNDFYGLSRGRRGERRYECVVTIGKTTLFLEWSPSDSPDTLLVSRIREKRIRVTKEVASLLKKYAARWRRRNK